MPAPFGPVRAIRSGPRTMSSARVATGGASGVGAVAGRRGRGGRPGRRGRRVPVRAVQAGHGQHGAPGRDGRARQVDPDLRVVPDRLLGLVQPAAGRLEPLGVQLAGPARGFLRGALAGVRHDPGQAARGGDLAAHAVAPGLLDLRLDQVALFPADVCGGRGDRALRRRLLGREQLLVGVQVAAVHADLAAGQVGDLVHQAEQLAVVADDHHHPGPGRDRVVQPLARVQVQVVGRLVQQQDVRAAQEQRGQRDQDGLPAGQPLHPVVEAQVLEAEAVQPGAGALLDVPVVPDRREGVLSRLARLDGVQRVPGGGDAEQVGNAATGAQGDGLRQVAHLAAGADHAGARAQLPGDELEQGRLARAVHPDQPGPARAERHGQAGEHGRSVGPAETEI